MQNGLTVRAFFHGEARLLSWRHIEAVLHTQRSHGSPPGRCKMPCAFPLLHRLCGPPWIGLRSALMPGHDFWHGDVDNGGVEGKQKRPHHDGPGDPPVWQEAVPGFAGVSTAILQRPRHEEFIVVLASMVDGAGFHTVYAEATPYVTANRRHVGGDHCQLDLLRALGSGPLHGRAQ